MKREDLEELTTTMQSKLGKEQSAIINDDLATIILDNNRMNEEILQRDNKIKSLNEEKEKLLMTNNQLFQQVAVGKEDKPTQTETTKKDFSVKNVFDDKGNFIN